VRLWRFDGLQGIWGHARKSSVRSVRRNRTWRDSIANVIAAAADATILFLRYNCWCNLRYIVLILCVGGM